jgi:hypothetical protein
MVPQTFEDIWKYSKTLGREVNGYVQNEHGVITREGTALGVVNDYSHPNTFHTHVISTRQVGADPPSSQDYVMLIDRLLSTNFSSVSDTVLSEFGYWNITITKEFTDNRWWIENKDRCIELTRGYFHWLNLMLVSAYFDETQYIKMTEDFNPCKLSEISTHFLEHEGEEGRLYVYSETELSHGSGNFPLADHTSKIYSGLKTTGITANIILID